MPLTHFICPDGGRIPLQDCLRECRLEQRCLSLPTLMVIVSQRREWSGRPSTTQLINGTMLEWLKITKDYAIDPRSMAYTLLGSTHHAQLAKPAIFSTEQQVGDEITGIFDLLEPDPENPGSYILTDYKTYGSWRVARILGIVKERVPHPTDTYKRAGPWGPAGTPKLVTVFRHDPQAVDMREVELQLNHYRILLEERGYKISRMLLQLTVRNGGTVAARERGINQNIYYPVEVRRLPDNEVKAYFAEKRRRLLYHLETGIPPEPCDDMEAWDGRRCLHYCEVAEFCPRGQREKFLAEGKEAEHGR